MPKPLKINNTTEQKEPITSSNLLFRTLKPATMAGFDVNEYIGDTMRDTKIILYRDIKINTAGHKWFVEFKHLIPVALRSHYGNRKWLRVKVYQGINVIRSSEYNQALKDAVTSWLQEGNSPFDATAMSLKVLSGQSEKKEWSIMQAVLYFKQNLSKRGLSGPSLIKYNRAADRFIEWLQSVNMQHSPANSITSTHIDIFLYSAKQAGKWSNTTFNGERGFLGTIFNFLEEKKIVGKMKLPGKLKATVKKHRYFDDKTLARVRELFTQHDPYLYFAHQIIYYLCLRSELELKNLRISDIHPDIKQVRISDGKTGDRIIPLVDDAITLFKARGIFDYPPEYYVISVPSKNTFHPDGTPGAQPFGTGFFSKRFAKIRKLAGLSSDYTMMGFRHSRIIHLKSDGVPDADIMSLTGHKTYEAYSRYLRDLGMTANVENLSAKTRRI